MTRGFPEFEEDHTQWALVEPKHLWVTEYNGHFFTMRIVDRNFSGEGPRWVLSSTSENGAVKIQSINHLGNFSVAAEVKKLLEQYDEDELR